MSKIMLIDGHSILNRAFYGVPDLTNFEGIHTNAMFGFLNIMFKFLEEEQPEYLTVAFDVSAPTFRHKAYADYKGTRKPMADELSQQVPLIKDILKAMNICTVELEGYEADDILGTIAAQCEAKGMDVTIISGDRDLLQLAKDHVKIRIPKTKNKVTEVEDYLPKDVYELYGVTPSEFIDMKALMGDSSDNIPGAPGVGPKTASALIAAYHTLDNVIEHIEELKPPKAKKAIQEHIEQVKLSRFLAEINTHVPITYKVDDAVLNDIWNEKAYELLKRFNFKSLLKNFDKNIATIKTKEPLFYNHIIHIENQSMMDDIFKKAKETIASNQNVGFYLLYEEGILYGFSLCLNQDAVYFALKGIVREDYIAHQFAELSTCCLSETSGKLITINLKDVLNVFDKMEICEEAFVDIGLGAYLINPNNDGYEVDKLALDYCHMTVSSRSEIFGKMTFSEAFMINIDGLAKYGAIGSYISLFAWDSIKNTLIKESMYDLFNKIEMPLLYVLFSMEKEGILVDRIALKIYGDKLAERISVIENEIYKEAGEEFNINSPKQLGVILFEKLNMPHSKKNKSGYSTAADVLEKLAVDYPIVEKILEYRQLTKLKSTYADGLAQYIGSDERIHGKFNQTITSTGRISSTDPNLQNIPIRMELGKQIRKVFIPKENCVFLDADYSQIELRILAHMSSDKKLIEAYNMAEDIHRITASQVFGVPFEEVTDLQRRNAKAVNFGIIYGISSFGLSQDLSISKKEAAEYIEQYFKTYPDIKGFIDSLVEDAKEKGYSLTMFNRRRPIPELKSSNFVQRSFGERVAMNSPIQGTAADIIKLAMINVYSALKEHHLKSRLILQVHDELLVETYMDELDEVQGIIQEAMENAAHLNVLLEIDMKQGKNWLEAH